MNSLNCKLANFPKDFKLINPSMQKPVLPENGNDLSHVVRKSVFGVSDKARLKLACSVIEAW